MSGSASSVGLSISRLVSVAVNLAPNPAQAASIDSLLVLGTSDVIDTFTRMRQYNTIGAVAADFSNSSDEYLSALAWFDQLPQPTSILIGRWAKTATSGRLQCAPLSAAQQAISNWTSIISGSFSVTIDNVAKNLTGLNFSGATNLNGVASAITTALSGAGTVTWYSQYDSFVFESATSGPSSNVSFLSPEGAGTDISGQLGGLSSSSGAYVVAGIAAESALTAVELFDNLFADQWYGLFIPGASDSDHLAIAPYIEADSIRHYYGVSTQEAGVLVSGDTGDIAAELAALSEMRHTCVQFSSSSKYAVASYLGRILTTDWLANNSTITLMYKQEPGIVPEILNATQASAIAAKNCNVFVTYNNNTSIIQNGVSSSGDFTDNIIGLDWLAGQIQTAIYNMFFTSPTKIPQTDPGSGTIATVIEDTLLEAVNNGLIAPGQWNSEGFGSLNPGDFLKLGYYVYYPPIATQAESVRATRVSVPFQIAVKMAGAVQTVDSSILVNF